MQMTQLVGKLVRSDVRLIGRDRFLLMMFGFAFYIALAIRFALPWANTYLAEHGVLPSDTVPQSLEAYYPMLVAFLALFTGALIVGTIFGFLLLDEKDHRTLRAMQVTPVPFPRYVAYRVGGPVLLAFLLVLGMVLLIGQALVPLWQLVFLCAGASLTAPIVSLFYAIFGANKVQGFAISKFGGVAGWVILLGWFVSEPLQWLFGLFPPFWISKAYWMALEGDDLWWAALLVGIVLQLGLIVAMVRRFNTVAYRS